MDRDDSGRLKSFRAQRPVTSAAVRDYVLDAINPRPSADVDNYHVFREIWLRSVNVANGNRVR